MMNVRLPSRGRVAARGFTLIELMVAIVLGLILLAALIALLVSTITSRNELDKTTRQIDNGRYALQVLSENIQLAGYVGASGSTAFSYVTPVACPTTLADLGYAPQTNPGTSKVPFPVYMPSAVPACIDHVVAGTSMVLVTRLSTSAVLVSAAAAGEQYVQVSNCATDTQPFVVAAGSSKANFNLMQKDCSTSNLAPIRKIVQQIYYLSSCNQCGKDTIPTLKVAEWVNGAIAISPLVEGVENFQVEFGLDMDGNGSPDCYVSNPESPAAAEINVAICPQTATPYGWTDAATNWSNVMTARVHVLARNVDATGGWTDTKTYDLGLANPTVGPFNDGYKRHAYSTVTRLYNPSGQREVQ